MAKDWHPSAKQQKKNRKVLNKSVRQCHTCNGNGEVDGKTCKACKGDGQVDIRII